MATESNRPSGFQSPGTPDRWQMLTLVALNYFTLYAHRHVINYFHPPLKADLGLSDFQIGLLSSAFTLPYCLAQIGVGYLGDRYRRRSVVLGGLLASTFALIGMALATNFEVLLACRILLAVGQSPTVPAMASTIADCFSSRTRSKAFGIYLVSYNCSLVLAGWIGGRVADTEIWHLPGVDVAGWRMAMFLFAGLGVLAVLLLYLLFREPKRTERVAGSGLGIRGATLWPTLLSVIRTPTFQVIALVFTLTGILNTAIRYWLARYYHDQFELSLSEAGLFATAFIQSGTIAGLFCGGLWADAKAKRSLTGRTAVQLTGLLVLAPALLTIGLAQSRPVLACAMMLYGFGIGLYQANIWPAAFEVVDPAARATTVGLLNLISGVLSFWFDPVIGRFHEHVGGLGNVFAALSFAAVISVLLMLLSMKFLLPRDYRGPEYGAGAR